jgi:hypothetical protein
VKSGPVGFKVLNRAEVDQFLEAGYVVVQSAFARRTAEALLPYVWKRLAEDPHNPSTWKRGGVQIEEVIKEGPVAELFTPRYRGSVDDLVGEGRWWTRQGFGWVILRFPGFSSAPWRPPTAGWHIDGIDFQHRADSAEQGLVGMELLTDIVPGGGGTAVRPGSHREISRLLVAAGPAGIGYPALRRFCDELKGYPPVEVVGEAGDVLWMHPHLVHARSPNVRDTIRVAANRTIALRESMRLDRGAGESESLVERAIRNAAEGR